MKIKSGFMLREISGNYIVVPVGNKTIDFNGIITLNKTGAFIWGLLENEISFDDLLIKLCDKFDLDKTILKKDLEEYIGNLKNNNLLD